jgi:hypothetical protein
LCSSTATFQELAKSLHIQYYQMLPLCGVVRSTPVGSRSVDAGFFGVGLPRLGVEALIAMSNKLLMHYGYDTATGQFMRISFNLFYLELGLLFQPMQESFAKYSHLVTHSCYGKKIHYLKSKQRLQIVPFNYREKAISF